jgi:hypothetical protein
MTGAGQLCIFACCDGAPDPPARAVRDNRAAESLLRSWSRLQFVRTQPRSLTEFAVTLPNDAADSGSANTRNLRTSNEGGAARPANMVDVGKRYVVPKAVATAHRDLMRKHAALEKEFHRLENDPFNLAAHRAYVRKIRAHLEELHKHTADLALEGERVHEEREIFHASQGEAAPSASPAAPAPQTSRFKALTPLPEKLRKGRPPL